MTPLEIVALAIAERAGRGAELWRAARRTRSRVPDEADEPARALQPGRRHGPTRRRRCPMASSASSRSRSPSPRGPRVLLLDEPAAGVPRGGAPRDSGHRRRHCRPMSTVLLIEHDMDLVFRFADRITVLVDGAVLAEGAPAEIARRPARPRGLSRRGRRWLSFCAIRELRAGYGEAWSLSDIDARARRGRGRSPCSAATASARRRWSTASSASRAAAAGDRARRTRPHARRARSARATPASAGCRRSATSSSRSRSRRT